MFDFTTIPELRLSAGNHKSAEDGVCFYEAVAFFAGEPHSDRPQCACPVLTAYGIGLNDRMPDDVRNELLRPLIPLVAGTRDPSSEQKRAEFLAMWVENRLAPIARAAGGPDAAYAVAAAGYATNAAKACESANAAAHAANAAGAVAEVAAAEVWQIAVEGLRQAILIGRHDGFQLADAILAERGAKLRELIG